MSQNSLKISIFSKIYSSYESIGEAIIDLSNLLDSDSSSNQLSYLDNMVPILSSQNQVKNESLTNFEGKIRIRIFIEELSVVAPKIIYPVNIGYKAHDAGVHFSNNIINSKITEPNAISYDHKPNATGDKSRINLIKKKWLEWEKYQEKQLVNDLNLKELSIKSKILDKKAFFPTESSNNLIDIQTKAAYIELKIRNAIESTNDQNIQLDSNEERINHLLSQKMSELTLLQRKVREESISKFELEKKRVEGLGKQFNNLKISCDLLGKKLIENEKEYEIYRNNIRNTTESQLKEDIFKLKSQVSKENEIISNENKLLYDYTVEKENYKLLIKRLISTLKREREKKQSNVREEIEQLRLEFLAREENYILDGDKNEIIDIRTELNKLKHQKLY